MEVPLSLLCLQVPPWNAQTCLFPCWHLDKGPGGHLLHLQKL